MGRKISLVALSAVLAFTATHPAVAQENGTFYVELVGPDEVVGEPEQQTYGPVRSNDTLWAIASLNRPAPSISVYQMMFAILKKNPQAFNNGNINSIVNGSYLTLPNTEEALAVSHQDAVNALAPKIPAASEAKPAVAAVTTTAPAAKQTVTPARPTADAAALEKTQQNLDALRDRLETRIDELEQLKRQEFDVLKQQMDESSQQMIGLAEVNHRMKMRIQELSDELSSIRDELNVNRRNQTQILQLLEKPQVEESQPAQSGDITDFLSSPLNIALVIFIPILLIALIVTLLLRRKAKRELEQQDKEMAESTLSLMDDENDEFSSLFSDNLDAEESQTEDLNAQFEDEPDLSVEDSPVAPEHIDDSDDDLEPEIEEASFEEFAAAAERESLAEIALDESEMAALDAFDTDDLVPSPEQDEQPDPDAVISADDLAAALAMDEVEEDIFDISDDAPEDAEELSFEEALKQQQEMEAELAEVAEQQSSDFENIDLSESDEEQGAELTDEGIIDFPSAEEEPVTETDNTAIDLEDDLVDLSELDLADPSLDLEAETEALQGLDETQQKEVEPEPELTATDEAADLANLDLLTEADADNLDEAEEQLSDDDIDSMFASFGEDAFKEDASTEQEDLPARSDIEEREFVDIDKLLNEADEEMNDDIDPYDRPSLDVDLDSFPDVLPEEQAIDVDVDAELASKLDLARAYLEIDDKDGAKKILQEVLDSDDANLKKEAEQLMSRFAS
ncbi:FimV/HubP family polar landmark protein [Agarivorans sp.]|uniref:FimV/HubP family polar landmark protein n=1 Tax=Agarivorans sp. TaxID=1872412 RepID=UPI003CFE9446